MVLYVQDLSQSVPETGWTLEQWTSWGLVELQLGEYLDTNPFGAPHPDYQRGRCGPICGGYRAILVKHKGDEKYVQRCYRTVRSSVSHTPCLLCNASMSDPLMLYTMFGPSASHRATLISTADFISSIARIQTFTRIPGWSVFNLDHDWLHIVDLAIIPECAGSALRLCPKF